MTTSPTSSEETVRRGYLPTGIEMFGEREVVAASSFDAVVAERDKWKRDWEAMMLMPFAKNYSALEHERDRLRQRVEKLEAKRQLSIDAFNQLESMGWGSSFDEKRKIWRKAINELSEEN